jgi:pyruvate dehydrogenase E1 component
MTQLDERPPATPLISGPSGPVAVVPPAVEDIDPEETREWLESLDELIDRYGPERARFIVTRLMERAHHRHVHLPLRRTTDYVNTIAPNEEPPFPGDEGMERRIRRIVRWNAAAMVTRANARWPGIGGHLSTYASAASLYEVGFNHFFRGRDSGSGDQVYFQGHATPGIYARAFLEGFVDEARLDHFRTEVQGPGLSSYPHPRLMPDFWEFPTVSMGLGPLNAIYQARFNRYLRDRGIKDTNSSRVWCFVGDGEMDEPESLAGLAIAARENLDNLIFVINCNLQRLDGPVRGNGKVIQELEALFYGAGWNVIKVIWGREWDDLLARDRDGLLLEKMNRTVDGEFQKYATETGAYVRERFFGPDPRLQQLVAHLSDDDIRHLRRGGHDYRKLYSAYRKAVEWEHSPTVILAKTVKGWVLGPVFEARNATHQIKKMSELEVKTFRDRLELPIPDSELKDGHVPYFHPGDKSEEVAYLRERRQTLGGYIPRRSTRARTVEMPAAAAFADLFGGTGDKGQASTTAAFVRLLRNLLRDKAVGKRVVPVIPDEGRTFGMDALFHEFKIYAWTGQLYEPVDAKMLISYREGKDGQILEEGITEAGSMASFTAAGTSYATHGEPMIPFFTFYSMFGFQRVGDLIWSFGDVRGRGFLLGGTAGRTTLHGEGLQHDDGHSLLVASTVPNCRAYDPAFAYEVAVIVRDGMQRMLVDEQDIFYYLVLYNENYAMPAMPSGVEEGIVRGLYRLAPAPKSKGSRPVQLVGSGPMVRTALEAQSLLAEHHGVAADVWSATSYHQLRAEALGVERWNRLHPTEAPLVPFVTEQLAASQGPIVAVSDWMKSVPDQVARWVPRRLWSLGTDGFGRSDTREALRRHFEVDSGHLVVAALHSLAVEGAVEPAAVTAAIERYGIDPDAVDPRDV